MAVLRTEFSGGTGGKPLIVFIHGMGMDITAWSNPSEARVLGGRYPLSVLLRGKTEDMRTSFADLRDLGYPVVAWSQRRPTGPIEAAVAELRELIRSYVEFADAGICFICHSRGGLVARKYLEGGDDRIRGLVTLAAPHHGTTMAKWAAYISPIASLLNKILTGVRKEDINSAAQRVLRFFSSMGLRELLPGSAFYASLKDKKRSGALCISIGGTNPDLVTVGQAPLSELMAKVVPGAFIPDEMKPGCGDGMVSALSSVLPYADAHYNFPVNHAAILFDRDVRERVLKTVESLPAERA